MVGSRRSAVIFSSQPSMLECGHTNFTPALPSSAPVLLGLAGDARDCSLALKFSRPADVLMSLNLESTDTANTSKLIQIRREIRKKLFSSAAEEMFSSKGLSFNDSTKIFCEENNSSSQFLLLREEKISLSIPRNLPTSLYNSSTNPKPVTTNTLHKIHLSNERESEISLRENGETTNFNDNVQTSFSCQPNIQHLQSCEVAEETSQCHQSLLFSKSEVVEESSVSSPQNSGNSLSRTICGLNAKNVIGKNYSEDKNKQEIPDQASSSMRSINSPKAVLLASLNEGYRNKPSLISNPKSNTDLTDTFYGHMEDQSQFRPGNQNLSESPTHSIHTETSVKNPISENDISAMIIEDIIACICKSEDGIQRENGFNKTRDSFIKMNKNDTSSNITTDNSVDSDSNCHTILQNKRIAKHEDCKQNYAATSHHDSQKDLLSAQCFQMKTRHPGLQLENVNKPEEDVLISNFNTGQKKLLFSPLYSEPPYESKDEFSMSNQKEACFPGTTTMLQFSPLLSPKYEIETPILSPHKKIDEKISASLSQVSLESSTNIDTSIQMQSETNFLDNDLSTTKQHNIFSYQNDNQQESEHLNSSQNQSPSSSPETSCSISDTPSFAMFSPLSSGQIARGNELVDLESGEDESGKDEVELQLNPMHNEEPLINQRLQDEGTNYEVNHENKVKKETIINGNCLEEKKMGIPQNNSALLSSDDHAVEKSNKNLNVTENSEKDKEQSNSKERSPTICTNITDTGMNGRNCLIEVNSDIYSVSNTTCSQNGLFSVVYNNGEDNIDQVREHCNVRENEQVVPESLFFLENDSENHFEKPFYDHQDAVLLEDKTSNEKRTHSPSFQWSYSPEALLKRKCSNTQAPPNLSSIIPLPLSLKRARTLRVGLSKKQKVKHLHPRFSEL